MSAGAMSCATTIISSHAPCTPSTSVARRTRERLQHALHHLLDVGFALAQVFVFDIVEMARQTLELFGQRPLHVVAARADQIDGLLHEHRIVQDH